MQVEVQKHQMDEVLNSENYRKNLLSGVSGPDLEAAGFYFGERVGVKQEANNAGPLQWDKSITFIHLQVLSSVNKQAGRWQ